MLAEMDAKSPKYDQEFFLRLARPDADTDEARAAARERWNAWRRDPTNKDVPVTFAGVDFRHCDNAWISFESFKFGDGARFDRAMFEDGANFRYAIFGNNASFCSAKFGDIANFANARFGRQARFDSATFGDMVHFDRANFEFLASFKDVRFGDRSQFGRATFEAAAQFDDATFGGWATFDRATFNGEASFRATLFQGSASFSGQPLEERAARDRGRRLGSDARGSAAQAFGAVRHSDGFGPNRFFTIDFSDARFIGPVSFARRDFEATANFTGARFHVPPDFDGATNLQRLDFTGARVGFAPPDQPLFKPHLTEDSSVPLRLRAFRGVAEATKNHDLERDLYIEERKAERGVYWARYWRGREWVKLATHAIWIAVMGAYWALSDYGRSLILPVFWLAATLPLSIWLFDASLHGRRAGTADAAATYMAVLPPGVARPEKSPSTVESDWKRGKVHHLAATRQLALANTIPFVGPLSIDGDVKKFLLCGVAPDDAEALKKCVPVAPLAYQGVLIGQNVLSALLLFFFGLALRNYFKVK